MGDLVYNFYSRELALVYKDDDPFILLNKNEKKKEKI
jgi:hypothetical protein